LDQLVTIELFGQPFTFKSESGEAQAKAVVQTLVQEVARAEAQQMGSQSNRTQMAALISAALNIANAHYQMKTKYDQLHKDIADGTSRVLHLLEADSNDHP